MLTAGFSRRELTPFAGVELTGWGYYLNRTWRSIGDRLNVTAAAFSSAEENAVIVSLDLMLIDRRFTDRVRNLLQRRLKLSPECILLTCTHSHNAPAAGGLRGVGQCDPRYEEWAAEQAVLAVEEACSKRQPAFVRSGSERVSGLTYNRTRSGGLVDDRLSVAAVESVEGQVLGILCNFAAHPTLMTERQPYAVSRDVPGQICDGLEAFFPQAVAMYLQGACGDTNFLRSFQSEEKCRQPAERLVEGALRILADAQLDADLSVASASGVARLPTRRWTADEVYPLREEAQRRLQERDLTGWRESIGRSLTNRPEDMVARHGGDEWKAVAAMCRFHLEWTADILPELEKRSEVLETEVQALRIGRLSIVANASEFFSPFALRVRSAQPTTELMIACYSNGRIGYLPDEHDLLAGSYAGLQSPRYCGQFPFTAESGPEMCRSMLAVLQHCARQ